MKTIEAQRDKKSTKIIQPVSGEDMIPNQAGFLRGPTSFPKPVSYPSAFVIVPRRACVEMCMLTHQMGTILRDENN